ncbi:MAG: SpoIVB peptidase S55 [Acidobacteriaceae bacterium]
MSQFFSRLAFLAAASLLTLLAPSPLLAQPVSQPPAQLPPHPPAQTRFFPLSQIRPGLQGVAYTVFQGDTPQPMGVKVLGVLHGALGPDQDMILVQLEGSRADFTGVVAGMSGSPVYIDGKLVGALAYRIGQFSKEPIGGVTPIQEMLQVRDLKSPTQQMLLASHPAPRDQSIPDPTSSSNITATSAYGSIQPIATPLVFSGFTPSALHFWKQHAAGLGLTDVSALGGSDSSARQSGPLRPGDAVSALLVSGDLEISATCTVTYVDPHQMLACGHPITQFGPVSMPMTKAEVLATLASPMNSFKIINTTQTIGAITQDRQFAIKGVFGQKADTIPVVVHLDGASVAPRTLHLHVVDQPSVTPLAVMVAVYQGLMEQNGYSAESSYRVTGTVRLAGYPSVKLNDLVAPTDSAPANLLAALVVGQRFMSLYSNAARRTAIQGVDLHVQQIPQRLTAQIIAAHADKTTIQAGDKVTVQASVLPWHGEIHNFRIPITLPLNLPPGPVRLLISDGATLDELNHSSALGAHQLSVAATIAQLNSDHPSDRLYVTLLAPEPQATLDGRTLSALPISMANVLEPLRKDHALTLHGESTTPITSIPVNAMLSGHQLITLHIVN